MAGKKSAPRLTPRKARNAIGVAKVIAPAVLPVLAPYALKAVAVLREGLDRIRARRLGVAPHELARFSGKGAALHARLDGAAKAIAELRKQSGNTPADKAFADQIDKTVYQLTAAVQAAERMPTARRRAAHRAVLAELDRLEQGLLRELGVG